MHMPIYAQDALAELNRASTAVAQGRHSHALEDAVNAALDLNVLIEVTNLGQALNHAKSAIERFQQIAKRIEEVKLNRCSMDPLRCHCSVHYPALH